MRRQKENEGHFSLMFSQDMIELGQNYEDGQEKQIPKEDRKDNKSNRSWSDEDQKIYWLGFITIAENNPLVKLSWEHWKVDRCFKTMEAFFKGRKTNLQIKSFDQRMKNKFKGRKDIDLKEAIGLALRQLPLTEQQVQRLKQFQRSQSRPSQLEHISSTFNSEMVQNSKKDYEQIRKIHKQMFK